MSVELIVILIVIVAVAAIIFFNRDTKSLDVNQDGKINVEDAKVAVEKTVAGVKRTADVNKDGKVDAGDVKAVATKARAAVKKTVAKKPAVKAKTTGRTRKS